MTAPLGTRCKACLSPYNGQINGWLKGGIPILEISRRLSAMDGYINRNSLAFHRDQHLTTEREQQLRATKAALEEQAKVLSVTKPADLAPLVRDVVYAKIEAGELDPTISEGLRAQEMLDRRAEKAADIELQLVMASVLGGGYVIEGEAVPVEEVEA